ncbi:MAG TPA: hypothetical protein VG052_12550 [Puia sp.]|nr:hypothetical protein [Puia sp.]
MTRQTFLRPLGSGLLGITLLLPASYFMLTLLARACFGAKTMYYFIAPSFLQTPFHPFAFHKAQVIIGSVLLAVLFNVPAILRFRLEKEQQGWQVGIYYRRQWLNAAIVLQGVLLLLVLVGYTIIQHIRY